MTTAAPRRRPFLVRLLDIYRAQLRIVWTWRGGPWALVVRIAVSLLVSVLALLAADWILPGFRITEPWTPVIAAIVLGLLNLVVRPVLLGLVAHISGIVVALAAIVLQVALILVLAPLVPGIEIDGVWTAFWASWIIALTNTVLTALIAFDQGDTYFGSLVQQLVAGSEEVGRTDVPGVVIVQIDGLAEPILRRQVRAGQVPVLSGWLRAGTHRFVGWQALLPSQTSASQAGILHGTNDGIPAFRWYDKAHARLMVSNRPADAAEIGRRVSNGEGLLAADGVSVGNLLTGDATRSYITMAALADRSHGIGRSQAFYGFFLSPYHYLHTIVRFVGEALKELIQASRQRRRGIEPRMHRGGVYPLLRAATNVLLRDLSSALVIEEMYRGAAVIYVDYTDYDEIAHHSGPERPEALAALDGVDEAIGALARAARDAARPYRFVVLSDHGQSLGATFRQRFGVTLEQVVRSLLGGAEEVMTATSRVEEWGPLNAFLSELSRGRGATPAVARAAMRGRTEDGVVRVGPSDAERTAADELPDLVVVASGNLGLISFPREPGRLTLEELADRHPGLVDALANHPGIGLVLVRSEERGAIAVGRRGIQYLDEGRVEGENPVAPYGPTAADGLRRLDGMEGVPDIAVISMLDPDTDEVAAFEELIGSHGGLGGFQTRPFLLYPSDWSPIDDELVGAPAVYRQLRSWLGGIGIGPDAARASPVSSSRE